MLTYTKTEKMNKIYKYLIEMAKSTAYGINGLIAVVVIAPAENYTIWVGLCIMLIFLTLMAHTTINAVIDLHGENDRRR